MASANIAGVIVPKPEALELVDATSEDHAEAMKWGAEELDWNVGSRGDFQIWSKVFAPDAFIAAKREGELLGFCSAPKIGDKYGYFGAYIVKSSFRGAGVGKALAEKAFSNLNGRNVTLSVSNPKMVELYREKFGFRYETEWQMRKIRITNPIIQEGAEACKLIKAEDMTPEIEESLLEYDKSIVSGFDRANWLKLWIRHENGRGIIAIEGFTVLGYGVVRAGSKGRFRLGPLYADNIAVAKSLLAKLLAPGLADADLVCDLLSVSLHSDELIAELKCEQIMLKSTSHWMRNQPEIIPCDMTKVYCVSDQEVSFI